MIWRLTVPMVFGVLVGIAVSAAPQLRPPPSRGEGLKPVNCANLVEEMDYLKGMNSEFYSAIVATLGKFQEDLLQWHDRWSNMDAKDLKPRTFAPLKETADAIPEIQNEDIYKTLGNIEERIDSLITCLESRKIK